MIDNFVIFTNEISRYIIPLLLVMIPFYGLVFKKIKVYESFVDGAKDGFNIAIRIIPYLVAILVAIGMFRASGALELLLNSLSPILIYFGFPPENLPLALMRPLSGSGSLGLLTDLIEQYGPESLIAKIGATTVAISTFSTQRELHWTLKHSRSSCVISISSLKNHNFIENLQEICPEYKDSKIGKLRSIALPRLKNIIAIEEKSIGAIINWHDLRKMAQMTKPENLQDAQGKVKSGDTCFILYTSGSTAEPKGVILAHGNVITNGYHIGERQALSDSCLLYTSPSPRD